MLLWFGWKFPNLIVWLIAIASLPRIYSLFRRRTEAERRYYEVTPSQRWMMSLMYFGLIAALALGMYTAHNELRDHPARRRDVIVQ